MLSSVKSISVKYDAVNEGNTFSPGDVLAGRVLLILSKETKIEVLRVKAKGKASVHWSEKHGEKTEYYSAKEKYFKLEQVVAGQEKGKGDVVLAPGNHVYPFRFQIPHGDMPPSFKGDHGNIVYNLEAKLSRSWRMPSKDTSVFTFVSKPEMSIAQMMSPQHGTTTKKMKLFTSGNVAFSATVDRRAYKPGEELQVTMDIQNDSSRHLEPKVSVDQIRSFFAAGHSKVHTRRILKEVEKPIPANTRQTVKKVLKLPPNLPVSIHNCRIIKVEYILKVYLDVPLASDPEVRLPLLILPADFDYAPLTNPNMSMGDFGAFPFQTAPGVAPFPTAPGAPPLPNTPGGFQTAPGGPPFSNAPGGFQTAPGAAPFPNAPGGFQTAPGAAPFPNAPGGFQTAPGAAPFPDAPGGFQTAPGAAPFPNAPGGFQTAPGAAPFPNAPGGFQTAPGAAPFPNAPGGFQTAPGAAPFPNAPGGHYTFLTHYNPEPPPPYDFLGQHTPQSFPSAPPPYSEISGCPPPAAPGTFPSQTTPGSFLPQVPRGTYPVEGVPDSTKDTDKSCPSSTDSGGKAPL